MCVQLYWQGGREGEGICRTRGLSLVEGPPPCPPRAVRLENLCADAMRAPYAYVVLNKLVAICAGEAKAAGAECRQTLQTYR